MSGSGKTVADGGLTLGGTAATSYNETLSGRELDNYGAATLDWYASSPGGFFELTSGALFDNEAGSTFSILADVSVTQGSSSTFVNAGTLAKTGGERHQRPPGHAQRRRHGLGAGQLGDPGPRRRRVSRRLGGPLGLRRAGLRRQWDVHHPLVGVGHRPGDGGLRVRYGQRAPARSTSPERRRSAAARPTSAARSRAWARR